MDVARDTQPDWEEEESLLHEAIVHDYVGESPKFGTNN